MSSPASILATSLYRFRHAIVLMCYFAVAVFVHFRRSAMRKQRRIERLAREEAELKAQELEKASEQLGDE